MKGRIGRAAGRAGLGDIISRMAEEERLERERATVRPDVVLVAHGREGSFAYVVHEGRVWARRQHRTPDGQAFDAWPELTGFTSPALNTQSGPPTESSTGRVGSVPERLPLNQRP